MERKPRRQLLGLLVVEGLLGGLVLDQLDAEEVAVAADVADDGQVLELLQGLPEGGLVLADVLVELLLLEDVEVRHARPRSRPGGRRRCSRARKVSVPFRNGSISRSVAIMAPSGA